jgi:hypothetical protein
MHKLSYFHLSAAILAFSLGADAEAPNWKAHSNTRLLRSEEMPNRHHRLERCRSSYRRGASNWASAGQAHRPARSYF